MVESDLDFAEAVGEGGHVVGEEETAAVEVADVAGEGFDLGEVVRGEEDGALGGALKEAFDEFVADERVEAGEGLVEDDERGAVGEDAGEGDLHLHAAGEMLELAVEREIELAEELLLEGAVPGGIEGAEVVEEVADGHPVGHFLVLGDVADAGEDFAGDVGAGRPRTWRWPAVGGGCSSGA